MQWFYSDYPVLEKGEPVLKSGSVEIKMLSAPKLPTTMFEHYREPSVSPRPLERARWKIASDVTEDLGRFIKGKYWHRIETSLLIENLHARGMTEAAQVYETMMANGG